jgi:hypothetical protein
LLQVLENDASTNVVSIAQVLPGSPADGFAAQVMARRSIFNSTDVEVQGDIIYEVDNFVVFRQPFNLWASVFNGSLSSSQLTWLWPDYLFRKSRFIHSYHFAKAQHQSSGLLTLVSFCSYPSVPGSRTYFSHAAW